MDTGAAIEQSILDLVYDGRLKECRSWINGASAQLTQGADLVGHGTHATSLVLKVTENTDCEVYVAQVFAKDPQKTGKASNDLELVAEGIANVSLRYEGLCAMI